MTKQIVYWIAGILMSASMMASMAHAEDASALQQQVEALNKRVSELEKRLEVLESPEIKALISKVTPAANPGDHEDLSNWGRLKAGLDYDEVRELLGEPVKVKRGAMEYWYYSDEGLKGPFVKFLIRKVQSWKAPQE